LKLPNLILSQQSNSIQPDSLAMWFLSGVTSLAQLHPTSTGPHTHTQKIYKLRTLHVDKISPYIFCHGHTLLQLTNNSHRQCLSTAMEACFLWATWSSLVVNGDTDCDYQACQVFPTYTSSYV